MKYFIFFLFFFSCGQKDSGTAKTESYILTEQIFSEDCAVYQMSLKEGDCIFVFSLAGRCSTMNIESYILKYSAFLKTQKNFTNNRTGKVIFNYYGFSDNKIFRDSLVETAEKYFKKDVTIVEIDEERITLEIKK